MHLAPGAGVLGQQRDSAVIDSLPELPMPTLHMLGDRDSRYRDGAQYMAAALPDSRLVTITGAGHSPHGTHVDEVATATLQFLAATRHCPASPARQATKEAP